MAASVAAEAGKRRRGATLATLARYGGDALIGAALTWFFYVRAERIPSRMHPTLNSVNVGLAYASLVLLGLTLAIGPLARLSARWLGRLVPVRRELGVVGGVLALVHVVVSAKVHLEWKWMQFFFTFAGDRRLGVDLEPYGIASWLGLVASVLLLPLLLTSNERAERSSARRGGSGSRGTATRFLRLSSSTRLFTSMKRRDQGAAGGVLARLLDRGGPGACVAMAGLRRDGCAAAQGAPAHGRANDGIAVDNRPRELATETPRGHPAAQALTRHEVRLRGLRAAHSAPQY